jgi:hypothetical protein
MIATLKIVSVVLLIAGSLHFLFAARLQDWYRAEVGLLVIVAALCSNAIGKIADDVEDVLKQSKK